MLVNAGMQALTICNGVFVSNRTLDQIYDAELRLEMTPLFPPKEVTIDRERKAVAVGQSAKGPVPVLRAEYRKA